MDKLKNTKIDINFNTTQIVEILKQVENDREIFNLKLRSYNSKINIEKLLEFNEHFSPIRYITLNAKGNLLGSVSDDKTIKI